MPNYKVHNVRFYKPKARAVYCMSINPSRDKIAVARSDAALEIWNITHNPFIETTIPPNTDNFSIEDLAWCNNRLFSVGLHGLLVEYDLNQLQIKNRATLTGEAAFCLDIFTKTSLVAVGTEQGYLNIFNVNNDEILFEKFLDKQEGRILCLKFNNTGEFIVSGGLDAIRVWSLTSGHALHRMTTGRSENNKPTIVWSLAITSDFTIVSGDSRGKLSFWDGKIGALIESYQSHRADILSVCLSDTEDSLFCSGVDPNVTNYVKVQVKDGTEKWVRSIQRKIHEHDVRALVLNKHKLYSSGADGYLTCSYHPPKTLLKYPPILQNAVTVCRNARLILLRHPKVIEVWSLGRCRNEPDNQTKCFQLECEPRKVLEIRKFVKNNSGDEKKEGFNCASISSDGDYIFYSTRQGFKLFRFVYDGEKAEMISLEIEDDSKDSPVRDAIFTQNQQLIVATNDRRLLVFGLNNNNPRLVQSISTEKELSNPVLHLTSSEKYLVAGDVASNVAVWTLRNKEYRFYCKLPRYKAPPTAIGLHPKLHNVVAAYADNYICEYDLNRRQLTQFSKAIVNRLPKNWVSRCYPVKNIAFDPNDGNIIILHDDNSVCVINKKKEMVNSSEMVGTKIRRIGSAGDVKSEVPAQSDAFHLTKKYKHLVHLSWLSDDEMVAVEVSPISLVEQLPPCFLQNTFGRK